LADGQTIYWAYFKLLSQGPIWFLLVLAIIVAITPDIIFKVIENLRNELLVQSKIREQEERVQKAKANKASYLDHIELSNKYPRPNHLKDNINVFYVPTDNKNLANSKVIGESREKQPQKSGNTKFRGNKVSGV
jgi:hypothetical protein